jgi:hypothetical protein
MDFSFAKSHPSGRVLVVENLYRLLILSTVTVVTGAGDVGYAARRKLEANHTARQRETCILASEKRQRL